MIYKIDQIYLTQAEQSGMRFISMSTTGLYFLAQGDQLPESIDAVMQYDDDQESQLLTDSSWIQPTEDV